MTNNFSQNKVPGIPGMFVAKKFIEESDCES